MPRFFREGDEVTISALVHNYLTSEKTVQSRSMPRGSRSWTARPREIDVPSKGEGTRGLRGFARAAAGNAVLLGKALTDEESDAMELTLPVIPFGVKLSVPKAGSLGDATERGAGGTGVPADARGRHRASWCSR